MHTKIYIFRYFFRQYLVLLAMVSLITSNLTALPPKRDCGPEEGSHIPGNKCIFFPPFATYVAMVMGLASDLSLVGHIMYRR